MTRARELRHDFGHKRNASFAGRYLSRDAYQHSEGLFAGIYPQKSNKNL